MTPSGIEPATFRFVVQYRNQLQLFHCLPLTVVYSKKFVIIFPFLHDVCIKALTPSYISFLYDQKSHRNWYFFRGVGGGG